MILVTGSAGKTGLAIIQALTSQGFATRALLHREAHMDAVRNAGAKDIVQGNLLSPEDLKVAFQGTSAVYHICPNVHPQEVEIGEMVIKASLQADVEHFVYHSVLHPQLEAMPHHWLKMKVEELLIESGLAFTILQPTVYMQNISSQWERIRTEGIYQVPYPIDTRTCLVDLLDVAEAAAIVLTENNHRGAVYELVGTDMISQVEIIKEISNQLGASVRAEQIPLEEWTHQTQKAGFNEYQISTLIKMFKHYQEHDFQGNPNALSFLLKRSPTSLAEFIQREISRVDKGKR